MGKLSVMLVIMVLGTAVSNSWANEPGIKMRLTENGMKYAITTGIKIMREDLKKKTIDKSGRSGNAQWELRGLRITRADFGNYQLIPVAGIGMRGIISSIYINANGKVWARWKKGWFKIEKTVGLNVKTSNVRADLTLAVGADANGRPTIDLRSCNAGVDKIDISFSNWLLNFLSPVIEGELKKAFGKLICNLALEEINGKAKSELATFPVIKRLDRSAEIDYSLTQKPSFTSQYMDVFLKGEFKPVGKQLITSLPVPPMVPSGASSRMLYFWLSDYTANTAGEVYHAAGKLKAHLYSWDPSVSDAVKENLNTKRLGLLVGQLTKIYGKNAPMGLEASSYAPPNIVVDTNSLTLNLFAAIQFDVKDKNGKIQNAFTANFHIICTADVGTKGDNITANIKNFDYSAKVTKSNIGKLLIPLDNFIAKKLIDMIVISKAKPILAQGFPLPKIDEVTLQNFKLTMKKDFIEIGTDLLYSK